MSSAKNIIYIDVLISVTLFINYFLLISVAKFLYLKINKKKLILGEILGAAYSLYIFLPNLSLIYEIIIKLLMALTIVLATFGFKDKKIFLKTVLCFFIINFAFSGLMFALWCTFHPNGMLINNGIVYFNISPMLLIISTVICYFLLEFINKIVGQKIMKENFMNLKINCFNKSVLIKVKIDTGCNLKEPFSALPVVIIKKGKLKNILPEEILNFNFENIEFQKNVRLIPIKTISKNGVLHGFKPDSIELPTGEQKTAYVAICDDDKILYDGLIGENLI